MSFISCCLLRDELITLCLTDFLTVFKQQIFAEVNILSVVKLGKSLLSFLEE